MDTRKLTEIAGTSSKERGVYAASLSLGQDVLNFQSFEIFRAEAA